MATTPRNMPMPSSWCDLHHFFFGLFFPTTVSTEVGRDTKNHLKCIILREDLSHICFKIAFRLRQLEQTISFQVIVFLSYIHALKCSLEGKRKHISINLGWNISVFPYFFWTNVKYIQRRPCLIYCQSNTMVHSKNYW